jgi:outer membrane lipoprotein LolB
MPRWGAALALILLVGACATAPDLAPTRAPAAFAPDRVRFELNGRIGVQHGEEGMSGLLRWLHQPDADEIWFSSPLGSSIAVLVRDENGVELVTGRGPPRRAATAEVLTREALGWDLPLSGLEYWILGRPAPGTDPARIERDPASGRLMHLVQDGWSIQYRRYLDTEWGALPALINLEYGSLQIRLAVDRWEVNP